MALKSYPRHLLSLLTKGSLLHLSVEILRDSLGKRHPVRPNTAHIKAGINWLLTAQQANKDGGVSAMYSLYQGWHPSYSETTGYIIPTMFNYYHQTSEKRYHDSALRMAEWELTRQMPEGAFPGAAREGNEYPIVFNTGQVIFGMVRAFRETEDKRYKDAASRAADWLVSIQESDGSWLRNTYKDQVHTYNTRVAWALMRAHAITGERTHKETAIRNVDWALAQQQENGWFRHNAFFDGQEPLVHTIAYAIRGILECGLALKRPRYIGAARLAADSLLERQRKDGLLAGAFDKDWNTSVSWSCLTGNSQMAIVWLRLHAETGEKRYLDAARRANKYVKSTQNLTSSHPGIRGGIKGAYPVYGWYAPFCFINWAEKFFLDGLMLEDDPSLGDQLS